MNEVKIGGHVKAVYNTGTYIGEVLEDRGNYILVEVLAVLEHPTQGDLHKPGQVEGAVFHERKALSYKEKMNVRKRKIELYEGQVPEYTSSLKESYEKLKQTLNNENTAYNMLALEKLDQLNEHYYQF